MKKKRNLSGPIRNQYSNAFNHCWYILQHLLEHFFSFFLFSPSSSSSSFWFPLLSSLFSRPFLPFVVPPPCTIIGLVLIHLFIGAGFTVCKLTYERNWRQFECLQLLVGNNSPMLLRYFQLHLGLKPELGFFRVALQFNSIPSLVCRDVPLFPINKPNSEFRQSFHIIQGIA